MLRPASPSHMLQLPSSAEAPAAAALQGSLEGVFSPSHIAKLTGLSTRPGREGGRAAPEPPGAREVSPGPAAWCQKSIQDHLLEGPQICCPVTGEDAPDPGLVLHSDCQRCRLSYRQVMSRSCRLDKKESGALSPVWAHIGLQLSAVASSPQQTPDDDPLGPNAHVGSCEPAAA